MLDTEIKTFIAVADTGSFNKAADTLFLSPTAVMKQITQLESRLGLTLFTRSPRGASLTQAGQSLAVDAKALSRLADETLERARRAQGLERRTIRVGTSPLYPMNPIVELWEENPEAKARFALKVVPFEDTEDDAAHRLLGDEMDVMAGPFDADPARSFCSLLVLGSRGISVYMPRDHRLAKLDALSPADLDGELLYMLPKGVSPENDLARRDIAAACPNIAIENNPPYYNTEVFNRAAEKGYLLLALEGWEGVHPLLTSRPLDVPHRVPFGIMHKNNPSETVASFLESVAP